MTGQSQNTWPLIKWPSKAAILKNMPINFKRNFKRCWCIIDCTEIFIARPSNLTARAQTWSNYKHNNTIKYLIAITSAGATYSPVAWVGWAGIRQTNHQRIWFFETFGAQGRGIADSFLIRDELAAHGTSLRIPHFTKGKMQLSAHEVDASWQLSRVRIHVERVIGRWKNFKILQTVIPLSQVRWCCSMWCPDKPV